MEALLATILFILLSPGLIVTMPPLTGGGFFQGETTNNLAVLVHAVLFFVINKLAIKGTFPFNYLNDLIKEISTKHHSIAPLTATILFVLLSPGFILTLPPNGKEGMLFSQETNTLAVVFHAVLYFILIKLYTDNLDNDVVKWIDDQLNSI